MVGREETHGRSLPNCACNTYSLTIVSFFIILGILLLYKYKGKLTPEEIEQKETQKKQYILSKNISSNTTILNFMSDNFKKSIFKKIKI